MPLAFNQSTYNNLYENVITRPFSGIGASVVGTIKNLKDSRGVSSSSSSKLSDSLSSDISTIFDNYLNSWQTSATKLQKDYIQEMKDYNEKQAEIAFQRSQTSADKQMEFQREMFDKQTAYNTLMSNTQYQRAVADLKKAGINPILAVSGLGGSVPTASVGSGASTQASAPSIGQANFANSLSVDRNLGSALSGMLTSAGKLIKAFF